MMIGFVCNAIQSFESKDYWFPNVKICIIVHRPCYKFKVSIVCYGIRLPFDCWRYEKYKRVKKPNYKGTHKSLKTKWGVCR